MKNSLISILLIAALVTLLPACRSTTLITISQLNSQPDKYNGQNIILEGYYFDAFEMMALCESLVPSSVNPDNLAPQGTLVWLEGGLPKEIHDQLYTQTLNIPSGYPEHYGKVRVTGRFQSGGQFGHLGQYKYQITVAKAEALVWTPSK